MAWKMYPKYGLSVEELQTKGVIYKITFFTENGEKYYIGQTSQTLSSRLHAHEKDSIKYNSTPIHKAINKYRLENCRVEIIDKSEIRHCLNKKEIFWIKYYRSYTKMKNSRGYNCSEGGGGISGYSYPKEVVEKMSGENRVKSIYKNKDVFEAKRLLSIGKSPKEVSLITNISLDAIYDIKSNKSWKSVGEEFNDAIKQFSFKKDNLDIEIVEYIKIKLSNGESIKKLSDELNISRSTISHIKMLNTFKYVREDLNDIIISFKRRSKNGQLTTTDLYG